MLTAFWRLPERPTLIISRLEIYATKEAWKMTHGLVSLAGVVGLHGVTSSSPHHNARVGVLV